MLEIKKYFGLRSMKEFKEEWNKLTEADRKELRDGIEDGTLTY